MTHEEMEKIFDTTLTNFKIAYPEFESKVKIDHYLKVLMLGNRLDVVGGETVTADYCPSKERHSVLMTVSIPFTYDSEVRNELYLGDDIEEPHIETFKDKYSSDEFTKICRQIELFKTFIKTYFEYAIQKEEFKEDEE